MLKIEESRNGVFTVKYNNKYLHSKYDPLKESENFIKNNIQLLNNNTIVVYGLGLGYHIDEILKHIKENSKIYIFEGNEDIIKVCNKVNSYLFNKSNIIIISSSNNKFYSIFQNVLKEVNDIIIHRPSLETIKDKNSRLYNLINGYRIDKESVKLIGNLLDDNYKYNLNGNYKNIKYIIEKFKKNNKPYIVTAAGPSLDGELNLLKYNRDKFTIVSVGTSLKSLMTNGIKPDILCIIDGKEVVAKQLKGYENLDVPLCFLSTASRWAVKNYKGPKYMFYNNKGEDEVIINTGKTVAVACIDIAVKCKAKEIILLGQDLAYLNGKSHTQTYEDIYNSEDSPIINGNCKMVKGIDGNMLETTLGYIYFKRQIEKIISNNKNINFINCSKGAFINGANHMSLKEYLNKEYLG